MSNYIWKGEESHVLKVEGSEVVLPNCRPKVVRGKIDELPPTVINFVLHWANITQPDEIFITDGSEEDKGILRKQLIDGGVIKPIPKKECSFLCLTDPDDVARVESKTLISTTDKYSTVPHTKEGVQGILGRWMAPDELNTNLTERYPGCEKGRTMHVIPYSMGPLGSPISKYGVELTDSAYVTINMFIMTRVSPKVWGYIRENNGQFVRCMHSIGLPKPEQRKVTNNWPCNPDKTMITHVPDDRLIMSFGSGYGGNSLLGKKCFALRIAGRIAYDEGWMAEHMLIASVTNPKGEERFITAAFPSACGKTNLAMLESVLPGYTIQTLGDDIAWMKFDKDGVLHAINPEFGFFGVAPGTNMKSNPNAMRTLTKNSIFTNVAETAEGDVWWEGLEKFTDPELAMTTWKHQPWKIGQAGGPASHPNARFTAPVNQCPCLHPRWEDPNGVPISAIIFGGRRPEGVPLVFEAFNWTHGVYVGAQVKSEATAAAEFKGKQIMHDPMAMRPFLGYNFGKYLQHWLDMEKPGRKMPKIFHVNWFRQKDGKIIWPGYCENIRVLDWILKRVQGEDVGVESAIGILPKKGSINMDGLSEPVDWDELFSLPPQYWKEDIAETKEFLEAQVSSDLPDKIRKEIEAQQERINKL